MTGSPRTTRDTLGTTDEAFARVSTPLWLHWARIARDQTAVARRAADASPNGSVLDEMHRSMNAISAVAHALDGLYGIFRPIAPPFAPGTARHRVILETFKHGFKLGKKGHDWLGEFDWLDGLRDPAIHPEVKFSEPTPTRWGNVAAEYALYSAESAERALNLLYDVLRTLLGNPKDRFTEGWAGQVQSGLSRNFRFSRPRAQPAAAAEARVKPDGLRRITSETTGGFAPIGQPKKVFRNEGLCLLIRNLSAVSSTVGGHGGAVSF